MRNLIILLFAVGCGGGESDSRTGEIWAIDFQTYGGEVGRALDSLGIRLVELEPQVLFHLEQIFDGIDVEFRIDAVVGSPTISSICIREGETGRIGRGFLDRGNTHVVHNCGEPDGTQHGAFINRIANLYLGLEDRAGAGPLRADEFGKLLAVVLAHEIGHGIGLEHAQQDRGAGDVMKSVPIFSLDLDYFFSSPDRDRLAANVK